MTFYHAFYVVQLVCLNENENPTIPPGLSRNSLFATVWSVVDPPDFSASLSLVMKVSMNGLLEAEILLKYNFNYAL